MRDLVVRVTALDPTASDALRVIAYFDELITGRAGTEALLRAAALLAGCPAGSRDPSRTVRIGTDGRRLDATVDRDWPLRTDVDGCAVWLERETPQADDPMILERLALAVGIARSHPDSAGHGVVERVLDESVDPDDRARAAARLRLSATSDYRVIARPVADRVRSDAEACGVVLPTRYGLVRAAIVAQVRSLPAPAGRRVGVGPSVRPDALPTSWRAALVALRLADDEQPIVRADDLGVFALLGDVDEARAAAHPDVVLLAGLADGPDLAMLDEVVAAGSTRAAARALQLHHSTVQARLRTLIDRLGYDPRTPHGRTRYRLARTLHRLTTTAG